MIIAIALGTFFSLTPPLLEAYDAINRGFRRLRRQTDDDSGKEQEQEARGTMGIDPRVASDRPTGG